MPHEYRATRADDGTLTIHDVPIFVECTRGEHTFDGAWIAAAVMKAKAAEDDGYFPPLHVSHHGDDDPVRPAGYFRVTRAAPITFKGTRRVAVFADLVITDASVEFDVLAKRLPYRSVEIFDVDEPAIDSLALLDHRAPYLELPMLMVSDVEPAPNGERAPGRESVACATFANPWLAERPQGTSPVVACFRRGQAATFFLQDDDNTMTTKTKTAPTKKTAPSKRVNMADDSDKPDGDDGDDGDDMAEGEGGLDVSAVVKAIKDGSISVADMDEILAAIQEQRGGESPEEPEAEVAPAPTPGEAMQNDDSSEADSKKTEFAALQGEVVALKARDKERDRIEQRRTDVAEALQRLDGRPMGSNVEENLVAYHKAHGSAAFKAHVDSIVKTFARFSGGGDGKAEAFAGQSSANAPASALAYTEQGTEAVGSAAKFAAEHKELATRGLTRMSEERYVASNMQRAGFKNPAPAGRR